MTLNVRPLGDRILVEPVEEKENKGKKGGIIIPDIAKEKPTEGLVVAVGTGKTDDMAGKFPSKSRRATACWSANTAALKSNWTARNSRSSTAMTSSPSSNNSQL